MTDVWRTPLTVAGTGAACTCVHWINKEPPTRGSRLQNCIPLSDKVTNRRRVPTWCRHHSLFSFLLFWIESNRSARIWHSRAFATLSSLAPFASSLFPPDPFLGTLFSVIPISCFSFHHLIMLLPTFNFGLYFSPQNV